MQRAVFFKLQTHKGTGHPGSVAPIFRTKIHLDTLQACFASIHFGLAGSLYLRNVFRSGIIPQNIFQHLNESYLQCIDLKQNNLVT
jgi:hypothetical protein